jgi:hypothetical protein
MLLEALARTLKNILRRKLREKQRELRVCVWVPYRQLIVTFLNQIFSNVIDADLRDWWIDIDKNIQRMFHVDASNIFEMPQAGEATKNEEQHAGSLNEGWRQLRFLLAEVVMDGGMEMPGRVLLFQRFSKLMSLSYLPTAHQKIREGKYWDARHPFESLDLLEPQMQIKHTNLVSRTTGNFYHWKALESLKKSSGMEALEFLQMAICQFEECLHCDPTNPQVLFIYLFIFVFKYNLFKENFLFPSLQN